MPYLDRAGVQIYYEVAGPANANDPLLLSHGYRMSSEWWGPNVAALAADRQVITWDLRGHGRSDSPDDAAAYTHATAARDMAALLDAAGADRAVIGGMSLGGYLSLVFNLHQPQRVAGLMLAGTGPGFRSDAARERWNEQAYATAESEDRAGHAYAARGMMAQSDSSVIDSLPGITVPTLILVGERDVTFLAAADYMTTKIPDATKVVIPDAGHVCNRDQPVAFNENLLTFLKRT